MKFIISLMGMLFTLASADAAPLPMREIAAGIYVHSGVHEPMDEGYHGDICNIGFIVGKNAVAVIDTGGSLTIGKALLESIRAVTPLPISFVINTHVHPDHIFGNAAFINEHPAFIGHVKLADAMERRSEVYLRNNAAWLGSDNEGSIIVKPTMGIDGTKSIDLGDRVLTLQAYPAAHTNTDLTVFDENTQTLWTGDLLFIERTPSIDGDIKGWLTAISGIESHPIKLVIPGHGQATTDWKAAFDKEQHYFETLLSDVRANIKKGISMENTMSTAAEKQRSNWVLFDTVNRRNVNIIYPALEWE